MAVPQDMEARRFYRVALQRMDDGKLILEHLNRPTAAIYLTGYAAECILKALLLASTPKNERNQTLAQFMGPKGHDLYWLGKQLRQRGVMMPPQVTRAFAYVTTWSTSLRYDPSGQARDTAETFLACTESVLEWAKARL